MSVWIKDVEGISNFRDLATGTFPRALVYRSADTSQLTTNGLQSLSKYVDTLIDVRSLPEIRRNGTIGPADRPYTDAELHINGLKRLHCPIFMEKDYSPVAIASRHKLYRSGHDGFVEAYRGILDNMGPTFQTIFIELDRVLSKDTGRGILIHCSAGKDRTGILCACLLLLAGVTPAAVAEEYALTTQGLAAHHDRIIASLGTAASQQDKETATIMMSSDAVVMERTIEIIAKDYGGIDALCLRYIEKDLFERIKRKISQPVKSIL